MKTCKIEYDSTIQKQLEAVVTLLDESVVAVEDGRELSEDERIYLAFKLAKDCRFRVNDVNMTVGDAMWFIEDGDPDEAHYFLIKAGKMIGEVLDEDVPE
jgi:DNA-binding XRE family transcriptional regulator